MVECCLSFYLPEDGMGLNIKNPETYALAKKLAAVTGESMTAAITKALEERLERVRADKQAGVEAKVQAIMRVVRDSGPSHGMTSQDIDSMLYDERGLPK